MKKPRRRWVVVSLAVLGVVVLGLFIAQDQEVLHIQSPLGARDPEFAEYAAALVNAPLTAGNEYAVLRNGEEVYPAMLDAIRRAERRISFESFIYSDGEVSKTFTDALAGAARRGVEVRVVLDAFGAADLPSEYQQALVDAGVKVVWFNTFRPWTLEEANYRTHRKVLVADGTLGFTGGVAIADHWRGDARGPEEWRDTQFKVTGPVVRALEAAFYENWLESGGREAPALDDAPPPAGPGSPSVPIWSNPTGGASNVKLLYVLSVAAARERIDIQSPYFLLDGTTRGAIAAARARGVRVRILTDGEITDARPVKYATRWQYQDLLDMGCEIYEYEPTMMHVKVTIVDGIWMLIGSANFDNRSLELNDELTVGVVDEALATTLTADFERDLARSRRIRPEEWPRRGLLEKTREWFWSNFGELF